MSAKNHTSTGPNGKFKIPCFKVDSADIHDLSIFFICIHISDDKTELLRKKAAMENLTKPAKKSSVKKHAHDGDKKGERPKAAEPVNSEERVER